MIGDLQRVEVLQHAEVEHHDHADEELEEQDELALRDQVRLAGLVDQLRDLEHRRCTGRFLSRVKITRPNARPSDAHDEAAISSVRPLMPWNSTARDPAAPGSLRRRRGEAPARPAAAPAAGGCAGGSAAGAATPDTEQRARREHRGSAPDVNTTCRTLISSIGSRSSDAAMDAVDTGRKARIVPQNTSADSRTPHRDERSRHGLVTDVSGRPQTAEVARRDRRRGAPCTRLGSAMPPVRKIRIPCSTVMSGNDALSRGQMITSPR